MTLHEAIQKLLRQTVWAMKTQKIADELNRLGWYEKKDGSLITPFQIHGRTKNYPDLFERDGSLVSLVDADTNITSPLQRTAQPTRKVAEGSIADAPLIEQSLLSPNNFKSAAIVDALVPDDPGLYCMRIVDISVLPEPFSSVLSARGNDLIYIGVASQNLRSRFLDQELRAIGHGTLFRSIGAILGYRPPIGSLANKANKRNYKFAPADEAAIIEWINANLLVNWVECAGDVGSLERELILKHQPLLNLNNNSALLQQLKELRAECVRIANASAI